MIRYLAIRNLAVIESASIEFEPAFNVLTGETGAGKSMLVEAVGLLLGGRASQDLVRTGEEVATVEAVLEGPDGRETVVRREVTAQGRSRAFIDDGLVTAASLRDLTANIVELHGQHDHQRLLDPGEHLALLDAWAGLQSARTATADAHRTFVALADQRREMRASASARAARLEVIDSQLAELDRVAPEAGEDERLSDVRHRLRNADRIERLCQEIFGDLYDAEGSVLSTLGRIWKRVDELAQLDSRFAPYITLRDTTKAQLEDLAFAARDIATEVEGPGELTRVEERLAVLERMKRKHGPTLEDVRSVWDALRAERHRAEGGGESLAALDQQLVAASAAFIEAATALSARRHAAAPAFARALETELAALAIPRARLEVRLVTTPEQDGWTPTGIDAGEFFFSANPGEDPRPLSRVASGGELSRLMLALRSLATRDAAARTLIFDEVDAGVGGRTGGAVGERLLRLGSQFQVLCITHLPQIAAAAATHFLIEKAVRGTRTSTSVTRLTAEARVDELARMLMGSAESDRSRASARELLTHKAKGEAVSKAKGESRGKRP